MCQQDYCRQCRRILDSQYGFKVQISSKSPKLAMCFLQLYTCDTYSTGKLVTDTYLAGPVSHSDWYVVPFL